MDILVKFCSGKELEVTDCTTSFSDHGITFTGTKELYVIPYHSIEFIVENRKNVKD